jgi:hypothetical protein
MSSLLSKDRGEKPQRPPLALLGAWRTSPFPVVRFIRDEADAGLRGNPHPMKVPRMKNHYAFVTFLLIAGFLLPILTHAQPKKPGAIAPAEKPMDGKWEEIDQRLIFLMVRLANIETSLDAVERAIGKNTGQRYVKTNEAKRAEAGNDVMDRKGGGPMNWSEFYGTTAEKFFYHPTDRNSSYHTTTILAQKSPQADNKPSEGIASRQGLPVHQRPPQFDYIYRANENVKTRAEQEAAEFKGKIDELLARRAVLEAEQSGLWCEVAFRAVSQYDLDKKPLYRFEPLVAEGDAVSKQHAETMKAAATFMRVALSIIDNAQKDQATTFSKIKSAVSDSRQKLSDSWLRQAVDVTDRKTPEGRFAALSKRLDDMASNLSESYVVAMDGDQAKDQQRKDTFRAMLQESLVSYAQIILALDEMSVLMKDEWKIKPDVDKPIQLAGLDGFESVSLSGPTSPPRPGVPPSPARDPAKNGRSLESLIIGKFRLKNLKQTWEFRKDGTATKDGTAVGTWAVEGNWIRMSYSDNADEHFIVITPSTGDNFTGSWHRPKQKPLDLFFDRMESTDAGEGISKIGTVAGSPTPQAKAPTNEVRVVSTWKHYCNGRLTGTRAFYSDGHLKSADSGSYWSLDGDKLTLDWGKVGVDKCVVSQDGRSFKGKNNHGDSIRGERVNDDQ